MKYNKPNMEIMILKQEDIVCTSDSLGDSTPTYNGDNEHLVPDDWT
jgi:hypothetical protein